MERGAGVSPFSPGFIAPGVGVGRKVPTGPAGSTTRGPCGPANPESNGASDRQAGERARIDRRAIAADLLEMRIQIRG